MRPKISPFTALKFRDFRLLWIGLAISRIGSEMRVVAVNWHVYLLTGSALSLAAIGLARFIPLMIFSIFGGITSDLFDRRKIMFLSQILMMASSVILVIATFYGSITPNLIYLAVAIHSAAMAFDTPARQSTVPHLVPRQYFMNATSLNIIMWQASVLIGPMIGGFIIAYFGIGAVYLLDVLSFFGIFLAILAMSPIKQIIHEKASFNFQSIKYGFSFVRKTPIIYSTMLLDFFATFFASATVLMPIFAKDIFKVGAVGLGFLYAAPALGAIIAGIITSAYGHIKNQGKVLLISVCIFGLSTILFGLSHSFPLSLLFLAGAGAGDMVSSVIRNTIRQMKTPDHLRGRMVSVNMIFFMGGPRLGEVEAGVAAAFLGAPFSVVLGGVGTIVSAVALSFLVPAIRKYKGDEVVTP